MFDANLPPALAEAVAALSAPEGDVRSVVHLTALFPPATPDPVWIPGLAQHGANWYVVSIDKFKKSHGAEREALRRAGHTVYVLDPQWATYKFWDKSARMVTWWPSILQHARLTRGGMYRVPWKHSSGKRFVSL